MKTFSFVGGSSTARSSNFDAQETLNLYPEVSQSGKSKSVSMLIGTPGTEVYRILSGNGGIRGEHRFTDDIAIVVAGDTVHRVNRTSAVQVIIGTITNGVTPVSMANNGSVVMLVTGSFGYFIDPNATTITPIADPDFVGGDAVGFLNGRFIWNKPGTGQFQYTEVYGTDISGLNFQTAESSPDPIVSLIVGFRELWASGQNSTEVFQDSGDANAPLARVQGASMEIGCQAKNSFSKIDNSFFWLGRSEEGDGIVWRAIGYQPQRISTHAVEFAIASYGDVSDAVSWVYQEEGHSFYVINFPGADKTWCYDISASAAMGEPMWHQRAWMDTNGVLRRHRGQCQMQFDGDTIIGDWESNTLYRLKLDIFSDNFFAIKRRRASAHAQFFNTLQIDMETGVGLGSVLPGQPGYDPQVMLDWSDDGGHQWSGEHWTTAGRVGKYRTRARWRRLGVGRQRSGDSRIYRVTITDPVKVCIIGAAGE